MKTRPSCSLVFAAFVCGAILPGTQSAFAADTITHQITLPAGHSWCDDAMIHSLFTNINAFRTQNGVAALTMDPLGMKDAELRAVQFAQYMATHATTSTGFNPHEGYETTAASLGYRLLGENLAYLTNDPIRIVYSIWQDPLHRAALLSSNANVAGVSCIYAEGTPYWTYEPGICTAGNCGGQSRQAPTPAAPTAPGLESEEWAFLTLINNYRAQNGAGPLQVSVKLQSSSQWLSDDMAAKNYASHMDSLGRGLSARLASFGYTYTPYGENIAGGYGDAQSTFNQWLTACDPDGSGACTYAHRKNMLNAGYKAIGIARTYNANSSYRYYWTTDFGGFVDQVIGPTPTQPGAPVINSFRASPTAVAAGQSATLSWIVTGATSLSIDGGVGIVTGLTSKAVTPAQTRIYKLTATNSAGTATALATVNVSTASVDTQPPSAPVIISAVARSSTQVYLAWNPSSDNVGVTGYQVLRNGIAIANVGASVVSYTDNAAAPRTSYSYSVRARDAAGNLSGAPTAAVTTPAPPVSTTCPAPATGAFTGCYYNNTTLTGSPLLTTATSAINFDGLTGWPAPPVPRQDFSVRWQGLIPFEQAEYTFTAVTSDGMRIYVDGAIILDAWKDHGGTYIYTVKRPIAGGTRAIVVEYYEKTGGATAQVSWQKNAPSAGLQPVVSSFTAAPSTVAPGQATTLSWNVSGATSITIDNGVGVVTGLYTKVVSASQTTTYKLTATNSAGSTTALRTVTVSSPSADTQPPSAPVLTTSAATASTRVYLAWNASSDNVGVAGYQVLRNGTALASLPAAMRTYTDTAASSNSTYSYSVRAHDAAGNYSAASTVSVTTPSASSSAACAGPATGAFSVCYYNNITLTGAPVLSNTAPAIGFDWYTGFPQSPVAKENFSARWQGRFNFEQGDYTFMTATSNGMRVYIDGSLVLDSWRDHLYPTGYNIRHGMSAGSHLIVVEFYEKTNRPSAHLSWIRNP